jgi:hypothetical protein
MNDGAVKKSQHTTDRNSNAAPNKFLNLRDDLAEHSSQGVSRSLPWAMVSQFFHALAAEQVLGGVLPSHVGDDLGDLWGTMRGVDTRSIINGDLIKDVRFVDDDLLSTCADEHAQP